MGTRCQVILPGIETERAEHVLMSIRLEINRIETALSRFIPHSEVSRLNLTARHATASLNDEMCAILSTCQTFHRLTSGAFDITLRPLMEYWSDKPSNSMADEHLAPLLDRIGMNHLHLSEADRTLRFDNESISLDFGGFGKGYAMHKIQTLLGDASIRNAFISFGESSVLTLGSHPAGDHWKIGLNDYSDPGHSAYVFEVNNGSVSTSSNFYIDTDGSLRNHRHVMDPKTGFPIEELIAVSVKSDSAMDAEILSTACLVMSGDEVSALRTQLPPCEIVRINYTTGRPDIHIL